MKKRNRLESYRKNAKNGALDKIASENPTPLEKSPQKKESEENIRKDSAKQLETDMNSVSRILSASIVEPDPNIIFSTVLRLVHLMGAEMDFMSISIPQKIGVKGVSGFNPHLYKCKCEACKDTVKWVKERVVNGFNEFGESIT